MRPIIPKDQQDLELAITALSTDRIEIRREQKKFTMRNAHPYWQTMHVEQGHSFEWQIDPMGALRIKYVCLVAPNPYLPPRPLVNLSEACFEIAELISKAFPDLIVCGPY